MKHKDFTFKDIVFQIYLNEIFQVQPELKKRIINMKEKDFYCYILSIILIVKLLPK